MVCEKCLLEATGDKEKDKQQSLESIKSLIKDSIRELALSQDQINPPSAEAAVSASTPHLDAEVDSFDFALVEPFITAVKDAIQWEENPEPPSKTKKYFPHLKKKVSTFPLMEEIKGMVTDEWQKVDRRPMAYNRFLKLYPVAEADAQLFDAVPTVDASVMRLARNSTLPLEDAVSFKDVLDRRIDSDLKKKHIRRLGEHASRR